MKKNNESDTTKRLQHITLCNEIGVSKASKELGISRTYLYKWIKRYEEKGIDGLTTQSRAHKSHPAKATDNEKEKIIEFVIKNPKLTYRKVSEELEKIGIKRHWMTIWHYCNDVETDKEKEE